MEPTTIIVLSDPAADFLRSLQNLPPEADIVIGDSLQTFGDRVSRARVLVNCFQPLPKFREVFLHAPKLEWVHSLRAGVENSLFPELTASSVRFTTSRGVSSRPLAEFVVAGALFFSKRLAEMRRHQSQGRWVKVDLDELHGKTFGILGFGSIGQHVASLVKAFGAKVIACRRHPATSTGESIVDEVCTPGQLQQMLSRSDFVVVCCPLTPETRGMIGEAEIAAMQPTAVLLNVARGPIVTESALVAALRESRIRGAVLDVFDSEPLPAGHPFYSLDNVLLSPHSANRTHDWRSHAMELFIENFGRFARGETLTDLVDKTAGY